MTNEEPMPQTDAVAQQEAAMRSRRRLSLLSMMSLVGSGYYAIGDAKAKSQPPEKPCIVCGKLKRHNNSFCSAECCRTYKQRRSQGSANEVQGDRGAGVD